MGHGGVNFFNADICYVSRRELGFYYTGYYFTHLVIHTQHGTTKYWYEEKMVSGLRTDLDAEIIAIWQVLRSWYHADLIKDLDPLHNSLVESRLDATNRDSKRQ
jgi:hypothetical protein